VLGTGDVIAGYRIEKRLGRGGMGEVYEAVQLTLRRRVALKVLSSDLTADEDFRKRFRREAEIQAGLSHPHIITVHDFGEEDGALYLVMRLVSGGVTLKDELQTGPLPVTRLLTLLGQVADALDAAHKKKLVHRDVKPQNILIEQDDAYLADFGLTRLLTDSGLTRTGQLVGTYQYIAPELINGFKPTSAADIYSLAAVLYECLTGAQPFRRSNDAAVLYAHTTEPPPRPTDTVPELPAALNDVIATGMAKQPCDRYATAVQLVCAARETLSEPSAPPRPPAETTVSSDPPGPAITVGAPGAQGVVAAPPAETERSPPRPPTPGAVASRGRRVAVVSGLSALTIGAGIGTAKLTQSDTVAPRSASSAAVALSYGAPWTRTAFAPGLQGLTLAGPVSLLRRPDGLEYVAGLSHAPDPTLVPASFRDRLAAPLAPAARVSVRGMQALRYGDISLRGTASHLSVLAIPTNRGAAIAICIGATVLTNAERSACDAVSETLTLRSGKPVALAPTASYARSISGATGLFNSVRAALRTRLQGAHDAGAQAAALAATAAPCQRAVAALHAVVAGPQEATIEPRITAALGDACSSYLAAARAARADDAARYAAARGSAVGAERELSTAAAQLRALGYRL
jgi:hypothetical protein